MFLGARVPILQAPIGGSAPPELAAAVANAGAVGGLALTGWSGPDASAAIAETRGLTAGPFFVNFILAFPIECMAEVLDSEVPIVTFSFGDPGALIAPVKAHGKLCGVQVGNLDGAKKAVDQGADFVICQGVEAGGRVQSTQALDRLLDSVVQASLGKAIVAAGGIASPERIRQVLDAGADAVMMGTRFVATQESRAHQLYKQRLVQAGAHDTAYTVCFMDGWPHSGHRVLRNQTLDEWEAAGCPQPGERPGEGDIVATMDDGTPVSRYEMFQPLGGYEGQIDQMPMYSGTGCGEIQDVPSAGELIQSLWQEATS